MAKNQKDGQRFSNPRLAAAAIDAGVPIPGSRKKLARKNAKAAVISMRPVIIFMVVDLPEPFGPR
jgi:hypothetical protein